MHQVLSWIILALAVIIFLRTYFLYIRRLQEGERKLEQIENFCHEFMSTVIQLMDELEEKKQQIEHLSLLDCEKNSFKEIKDCHRMDQGIDQSRDQTYSDVNYSKNNETVVDKFFLYQQIKSMLADGKKLDAIAKEIGIGIGEAKLILSLYDSNLNNN